MNLSTIERRVHKLEGQGAMQRHIIIVRFDGNDDGEPINMLSHHGEVFSRKANEPHDVFVNRAAGDAEGVIVIFAISNPPAPKHSRIDGIFLAGHA